MTLLDQASDLDVVKAFNAAIGSNTTTNGDWIDLSEYHACTIIFIAQSLTDGTYTPVIQDADESNQSDAAAVDDKYLTEAESDLVMDAANEVAVIGYTGPNKYVRPQITSAGVTSGATIVGLVVKGEPEDAPVDHAL